MPRQTIPDLLLLFCPAAKTRVVISSGAIDFEDEAAPNARLFWHFISLAFFVAPVLVELNFFLVRLAPLGMPGFGLIP